MQRSFGPMRKQVETWQQNELTDVTAKVVIYEAFVEGELEAPKHLASNVHDLYFELKIRRIPVANHLEPVEYLHICTQGTRAHSAIQGHGEVGEFPETHFSRVF